MTAPVFGATPTEWAHFDLVLGLTTELLPVVSNPSATISPNSKIKGLGKTPSQFNRRNEAVGIPDWTKHISTGAEISAWAKQPDYGICVQTRFVRAIDIDIPDADEAGAVAAVVVEHLGELPMRYRENSGKCLQAIVISGDMPKRIITAAGGKIEFLATGQQFIAIGMHTSGVPYRWSGGLPDAIPEVSPEKFEALWSALQARFGVAPPITAGDGRKGLGSDVAYVDDELAAYLDKNGWTQEVTPEGHRHITCPWSANHTTGVDGDTSTTYFIPGGDYERGHFKCLHGGCAGKTDEDFIHALGVLHDDFDVLPPEPHTVTPDGARFRFETLDEFAVLRDVNYIVDGVLPIGGLGVVFGESGSGKTFFVLDLVMSIARGTAWRDRYVEQGAVAYICAEGSDGFRQRTVAYRNEHGLVHVDVPLFVLADSPNFLGNDDVGHLLPALAVLPPLKVIVVDTWAQVTPGGNENSADDMGKALARCRKMHKATGAMVLLIHHAGKDSSKGARGWSGLRAAADVEIEITKELKGHNATITKMKDGAQDETHGFILRPVVLGLNKHGKEITSCVLEVAQVTKTRGTGRAPGEKELQILAAVEELGGVANTGIPEEKVLEYLLETHGPFETPHAKANEKSNWKRSMKKLEDKKYFVLVGGTLFPVVGDL